MFDLVIKNGKVVCPDGITPKDIGITDGKIVAIESQIDSPASSVWDAGGNYVFPGMIDPHVHFNEPGRADWEGFSTGSVMMAAGGCTTYFDMPLNGIPSTIDKAALLAKSKVGQEKSTVDFGLWGGLVPGNSPDLKGLAETGAIGFKAFMSASGNAEFEAADDVTLLRGMQEIAKLNKILALHAESDAITTFMKNEKEKVKAFTADDYAETRPITAEVEAVTRALYFAELTGCPLHFVHISSAAAIEQIEAAKQKGMNVTVETCPHYLLFNHDDLIKKGSLAKCAPPLRVKEEQEKLIELIVQGKFDFVASDHSPCPYDKKDPATHHLFSAWGGINGGQFTLMAMIELALKHDIAFETIAKLTSTAAANRFGLTEKGKIEVGMDADLAIVTVNKTHTVTEENFFAKHKQSLYMGHTFPCRIENTFLRGELVYQNDDLSVRSIHGEWLVPGGRTVHSK